MFLIRNTDSEFRFYAHDKSIRRRRDKLKLRVCDADVHSVLGEIHKTYDL